MNCALCGQTRTLAKEPRTGLQLCGDCLEIMNKIAAKIAKTSERFMKQIMEGPIRCMHCNRIFQAGMHKNRTEDFCSPDCEQKFLDTDTEATFEARRIIYKPGSISARALEKKRGHDEHQ